MQYSKIFNTRNCIILFIFLGLCTILSSIIFDNNYIFRSGIILFGIAAIIYVKRFSTQEKIIHTKDAETQIEKGIFSVMKNINSITRQSAENTKTLNSEEDYCDILPNSETEIKSSINSQSLHKPVYMRVNTYEEIV